MSIQIYLPVCLYQYTSMFMTIYLTNYLSIYLSIDLSIYLSIHQSVYLSICLSVCLSVWLAGWLAGCSFITDASFYVSILSIFSCSSTCLSVDVSIRLYASQLILHCQLSHPMIYLSFYLRRCIEHTEYTPTYLSPALSLASSFDLSYFYQSIFPSFISFYPSIHPSIHRFIHLFIHASIFNNMDQWIYNLCFTLSIYIHIISSYYLSL